MRAVPFKRIVFFVGMPAVSLSEAVSAENDVMIQMPEADLRVVLDFYSILTRRKVFLDIAVSGSVAIEIEKRISKEEAIQLIRTTLLENHGIEMREPNAKETFVTWSADPKYKEVIEPTKKPARSPARAENPPGRWVRIVR